MAIRYAAMAAMAGFVVLSIGCVTPDGTLTPRQRAVAAAARPILDMDPDAVWSDCFNRLVDLGPASIDYLMRQPEMREPAAPDNLRVMLHTSLVRLLANPATRPRLSANCLETTLDVLHFDIKVGGDRPGTPCLPTTGVPRRWHDLYPFDFDHALAGRIDAEADRRAVLRWWREHAAGSAGLVTTRRLHPKPRYLWRLLHRHAADRWAYQPDAEAVLCSDAIPEATLLRGKTRDYNLVRATCVFLGSRPDEAVQMRLIELIGGRSPVAAYNARFALSFCPDERIRAILGRYEDGGAPPPEPNDDDADREVPIKL